MITVQKLIGNLECDEGHHLNDWERMDFLKYMVEQ